MKVVMGTDEVLDNILSGIFVMSGDDDDGFPVLVIAQRPDWVIYPVTGEKFYVKDIFVLSEAGMCPNCYGMGRHGVIVLRGTKKFVVCCGLCGMTSFVEVDGNAGRDDVEGIRDTVFGF